jgi:hypothetical protein
VVVVVVVALVVVVVALVVVVTIALVVVVVEDDEDELVEAICIGSRSELRWALTGGVGWGFGVGEKLSGR